MVTWTSLGIRQLVSFYDPLNKASTQWSPQINPVVIARSPGNVRKYTKTTNGTSIIIGDREYPPLEMQLQWDQLDYSDYLSLRAFTSTSPIVFVDNNDQGFLGVMTITKAGQVVNKTKNVWAVQASFLTIAPFGGLSTPIAELSVPTLSSAISANAGYIPISTTINFWLTVFTSWGESLVGTVSSITTTAANQAISLTWTQPTSSYFTKARLYYYPTNVPTTATFLTEVQAGYTGSFTLYGPYVEYSTITPPSYSTAFTGTWNGGTWIPGT